MHLDLNQNFFDVDYYDGSREQEIERIKGEMSLDLYLADL